MPRFALPLACVLTLLAGTPTLAGDDCTSEVRGSSHARDPAPTLADLDRYVEARWYGGHGRTQRGSPGSHGGEWKEEYREGSCEVKVESKRDEFKREIKCRDGIGAHWRGRWKREYADGPCRVKVEATREVYKEEVKCADA